MREQPMTLILTKPLTWRPCCKMDFEDLRSRALINQSVGISTLPVTSIVVVVDRT